MGLFGSSKKSSGIFVPHGNGFRELTDTIENKSINGIAEYLGYNTNEFHTFIGNWNATNEIQTIVTKIFTTEILFLITLDSITEMPKSAVDQFMMNFNFNNEYDSLNVKAMLTEGIENKSLKLEYLAQVLGFDPQELDGGGIIFSEKLNLYLYFSNGLLVDFSSGDGFNEGARFFQSLNPGLFEDYVSAAEHVWGEDTQSVKRMLNIQSECMTKTPEGFNNSLVEKHRGYLGTINFRMLLVCHYKHPIGIEEFQFITKGQSTQVAAVGDPRFWYNNFLISFDGNGNLIEILENPNR